MSGNGSTTVQLTSVQQDEIRRNVKARQRRGGRGGSKTMAPGNTLLAGIQQDRDEARRVALEKQATEQLTFRVEQAKVALGLLDPKLDGIARKVAELVINSFPAIVPEEGTKRTQAAEDEMLTHLSDEELKRTGAISKGKYTARRVLTEAYNRVRVAKANKASV